MAEPIKFTDDKKGDITLKLVNGKYQLTVGSEIITKDFDMKADTIVIEGKEARTVTLPPAGTFIGPFKDPLARIQFDAPGITVVGSVRVAKESKEMPLIPVTRWGATRMSVNNGVLSSADNVITASNDGVRLSIHPMKPRSAGNDHIDIEAGAKGVKLGAADKPFFTLDGQSAKNNESMQVNALKDWSKLQIESLEAVKGILIKPKIIVPPGKKPTPEQQKAFDDLGAERNAFGIPLAINQNPKMTTKAVDVDALIKQYEEAKKKEEEAEKKKDNKKQSSAQNAPSSRPEDLAAALAKGTSASIGGNAAGLPRAIPAVEIGR